MIDERMKEHCWGRNLGALVVFVGIVVFLSSVDSNLAPSAPQVAQQEAYQNEH